MEGANVGKKGHEFDWAVDINVKMGSPHLIGIHPVETVDVPEGIDPPEPEEASTRSLHNHNEGHVQF